jgi:hypothetical protein
MSDFEITSGKGISTELVGVRFSAGLLFALGSCIGFYALMYSVMGVFIVLRGLHGHDVAWPPRQQNPLAITIALCVGLAFLCFKAGEALRRAQRWGAYVAMAFGLVLLLFGANFAYDIYHPERQIADEGFAIFFVPFFVAAGLWWCIYLNLPHVRAEAKARRSVLLR